MAAPNAIIASSVKSVQFYFPLRVIFAYVGTGPAGADLIFKYWRSSDRTTWTSLATITVADGTTQSYSGGDPPEGRQAPYSGSWPFPIIKPGQFVGISVEQVGSGTAGSDAVVESMH